MTDPLVRWFAVRFLFKLPKHETGAPAPPVGDELHVYEERIVLVAAVSAENAIERAEVTAREYVQHAEVEWLKDFAQTFELFEDEIEDCAEVWSHCRKSRLSIDEYCDRFFDTGHELGRCLKPTPPESPLEP